MDRSGRLWKRAKKQGVVDVDLGVAWGRYMDRLAGAVRTRRQVEVRAEVSDEQLDILREVVRKRALGGLAEAQLTIEADLIRQLDTVWDAAVAGQWTKAQLREELGRIADRIIETMTEPGGALATTIRDETTRRSWTQALKSFPTVEGVSAVWPYQRHRIRGINTRPNHAALEGFIWRTGWSGESSVIAPLGWNCFCRAVPVPWEEATALGYSGDLPDGTGKLAVFIGLGGPDADFPRSRFVSGIL